MNNQMYLKKFQEYMVPTYQPQIVFKQGKGSKVWDVEGKEYIDLAGGIAVLGLGHCHPQVVKTLQKQSEMLWHLSNVFSNPPALELAQKIVDATFADKVFFCNSGAEANEAALKLARRYAFDHFGEEKNEIISFQNSFHGRTLFTVSTGGQKKYCTGFGPIPSGIIHAQYNDIEDVTRKISSKTCAVIMEPIQGEGGVIPAEPSFAREVKALCQKHNALLIYDEIQTGMGRTGKLYTYEHLEVIPDILTSAKSIANGFPLGAMMTQNHIAKSFIVGTHGTTYGGNPLATAVANTVFELINTPEVLTNISKKRNLIEDFYIQINEELHLFETIRGKGLLIGFVLNNTWKGKARDFLQQALQEGVMSLVAGPDVIRLAPSLIIPEADLQEGLFRLGNAFKKVAKKNI